jgi:ATP-dependent DNA helicase RecG
MDEQLKNLINQGEGYNLEFKESFTDGIKRDICAFANTEGGFILLGVNDENKIVGIKDSNDVRSKIQNITRNLDPSLTVELEYKNKVMIIKVPEGTNKPYAINGKFLIREGASSQQLTRDEVSEFFRAENIVKFDEKVNQDFNLDNDFDKEKFKTFLKLSGIDNNLDRDDILNNLLLLEGDKLKNAGVLFFCHRTTKFFHNALITCVLYKGKEKVNIIDRKDFDADLHSNYQNAIAFLQRNLRLEYIMHGFKPREERLEIPEDALREAVLNSIAHRDYFEDGAKIQIDIFDDRVEISNPGGLIKAIKPAEFGRKSISRNPLLFGLMQRMNLVEKVGSGISKMKRLCKEAKLKEPKFDMGGFFTVTFFRPSVEKKRGEKWGEKWGEKLTENQEKILGLIVSDKSISIVEISKKLKLGTTAVENNIAKLKKMGLLKRVGPAKGGHWEIKG